MTDADFGRPGAPSSAAPIEPVPVSPLRASVPDAGVVQITNLNGFLDALRDVLGPQLEQQRTEWEREGPAAEARAAKMGITFKSKGGNCPVQAEGAFDGNEFYFRARGDEWQFHVGPDAERFGPNEYVAEGEYGEGFDAGWMPLHTAIAIICAQVEIYRAAQGIEARSDETAQQAQPEGQEPDPKGCAQSTPTSED